MLGGCPSWKGSSVTEIEERGGEAAAGQAAEQDLEVAIARGLLDQARARGIPGRLGDRGVAGVAVASAGPYLGQRYPTIIPFWRSAWEQFTPVLASLNSLTMYYGDRINLLTAITVSPTKSRQFRSALVSAAASRRSVFARATQARTAVPVRSKSRATCHPGSSARLLPFHGLHGSLFKTIAQKK
jgi:hypothetical protein